MFQIDEIKNILVIRLGKIGDLIVTSFVFEAIKNFNKNINIDVLTFISNKPVLEANPKINNKYFSKKNLFLFFSVLKLNKNNYDLILDFNDNFSKTSLLLFKLLKSKYKAAYNFKEYLPYINLPVNQMPQNKTHIIERMDYFLKQLGFVYPDELIKPKLYIKDSANLFAQNLLSKYSDKNKIIALNLSAGAEIRYWTDENWIKLINLIKNYDNKFLFIPLCMEKDIKIKNSIFTAIDNKYLINVNNYSFQEYAAFISKSDFLISPDTSAIHIASSFDVPVVGLYPNPEWNLVSWRPYQKHYRILSSKTEYINEIEPEQVFEKFIELKNELKNVK